MSAAFQSSTSCLSQPTAGSLLAQGDQTTLPVQFGIISSQSEACEIVLKKRHSELNLITQTSLQWMNIYPESRLVIIGHEQANYPSHDKVHEGLNSYLKSENHGLGDPNLSNAVAGFRDGNKYIVRIDGLGDYSFSNLNHPDNEIAAGAAKEILTQLKRYETAIQLAETFASKSNGEVVLQADFESQKLVAKILGRLHQVDEGFLSAGQAGLSKKIQFFNGIPHIYDNNRGTRYFFLKDLENFAERISLERGTTQELKNPALHLNNIKQTLSVLVHFFIDSNPQGYRHGRPFLMEKNGIKLVSDERVHSSFAKTIEECSTKVASASPESWHTTSSQISHELQEHIKKLSMAYPKFNSIDLSSVDFVQTLYSMLSKGNSKLDLGKDFSTPLTAQPLGRFVLLPDGSRRFDITSEDSRIRNIANYLVGEMGSAEFLKQGAKILPSDAAYITCLTHTNTPLTAVSHQAKHLKDFGHIDPKTYVFAWGQLNHPEEVWIFKEDVWDEECLARRNTDTVSKLLSRLTPSELSQEVKLFKSHRYKLSKLLLTGSLNANLAEPSFSVSVQEKNYDVTRFVPGERGDRFKYEGAKDRRLLSIMEPLGDLIAAGIISQRPNLHRRDTIIHELSDQRTTLTLLGPGESFSHSHRAKDIKEYLGDFVPQMYGNLLAQWLTPIARMTADLSPSIRNRTRQVYIAQCLKQVSQRLQSFSSELSPEAIQFRDGIGEIKSDKISKLLLRTPVKQLDVERHLKFTEKILNIDKKEIRELCRRIAKATLKELILIDKLAAPPRANASVAEWRAFEECAIAVSSLIERHLPESEKFRRTIDQLHSICRRYDLLSVPERTWYISLLDVSTRALELGKKKLLVSLVNDAISLAADEQEFEALFQERGQELNLPYEIVKACYRAVLGLRAAIKKEATGNPNSKRLQQLKEAAKGLRRFK